MPDKYVFPGGKTDRADQFVAAQGHLSQSDLDKLRVALGKTASLAKLLSVALSAIRELHEETGLVIGRPIGDVRASGPFASLSLVPFITPLRIIARAVTPPIYPRRFDTHFFAAFRDEAVHEPSSLLSSSDELLDLGWFTLDEAKSLDLPQITQVILEEVETRLSLDPGLECDLQIPCYIMRRGQMRREMY
jgi:8-oxo-dGTP pyrophosphatase MutT (NUDIX family)